MRVGSEFVQKINSYLFFRMSKSTHITIVARFNTVWVALAEFDFIFFWMIKLLNTIMRSRTAITQRAIVS